MKAQDKPQFIQNVKDKWRTLFPHLLERPRRLWAATEACALGHGGIEIVHQATGLSRTTLAKALRQLREQQDPDILPLPKGRQRKPGGGRKPLLVNDATLLTDLEDIIEPSVRGDPQSPLRWTSKSLHKIEACLKELGHTISHQSVRTLLQQRGYSLQANQKTKEGDSHPDRDAQFGYINEQTRACLAQNQPVISIDCKKKELVGNFKNAGREWHEKGKPDEVLVHDFVDKQLGKAIPYGVYDVAANAGFVNVGMDHDTAAFAVASIRRWWESIGKSIYPKARQLQIMADGGGSNASRSRLFKVALQEFANETRLSVSVSHFPPGTSKWNKIEHRLFSFITMNWRGRPLMSLEVIISLIGSTTTMQGLSVTAQLDNGLYPTKIKVSEEELSKVCLHRHDFHGEWNYTILPQNQQVNS